MRKQAVVWGVRDLAEKHGEIRKQHSNVRSLTSSTPSAVSLKAFAMGARAMLGSDMPTPFKRFVTNSTAVFFASSTAAFCGIIAQTEAEVGV